MAVLEQLEPKPVFHFFEEICAIPHGSGNTKGISDYLVRFAHERGLAYRQDEWNNVIIWKPASPGYEQAQPVILQGHMDMVCEKAPDCTRDMAREGLSLGVEGDTVFAHGTTLGGDDGIAVAMNLAVLDREELPHPALEAVFTVDEETGMDGAREIDLSVLRGRRLINIDSEEEGVFTVSCAGGCVARCVLPLRRAAFPGSALRLEVGGLTGGHSGIEIHKGRANANQLLGRVLLRLDRETELRLIRLEGGLKDNAIPQRASAELLAADARRVSALCGELEACLRREYGTTDSGLSLRVTPLATASGEPMDRESGQRALCLLCCLPGGVQAMSADVEGLVQTSLNLGILRTDGDTLSASLSVRSSLDSQKRMLVERLDCLTRQLGGSVEVSGDYPGWAYRKDSPLRELMSEVFARQYGHPPVIEAVHAGLECGLFAGKLPELDCVSIGPDISNIHTCHERLHIASVQRTWQFLTAVLERMR